MIIKSISVKNFFRYGNEQTIDLSGSGITAVAGFNGYGKSTLIVDSILFALYAKYRCDTIDDVVNRYIGKDCKVSIEFEESGKNYKVIRYRKHSVHNNNVYLFCGDKDISGHTASETNNKIIDLIKFNHIAFTNSSVFSSELYSAFLANKVSERLIIFENILSLKEITQFYTTTKDILKELNDKRSEEITKISSSEAEINALNSSLSSYNENARSKLLEMKSNKEKAKKEIEEANKKISEYSIVNIEEEKKKISNLDIKINNSKEISKLNDEKNILYVKEPIEELAIYNKYKDVDFEENRIKEEKYKEDVNTMSLRENGYKLEMSNISSINMKKGNLSKELNSNQSEILENERKREKLLKAECPFCGQHLETERSKAELEICEKKIASLKSSNEEIKKELENLEVQFNTAKENYDYLLSDYNRIKEHLDKNFIPNSELVFEQYKNAKAKIEEVEEAKKKVSQRIAEIDEKINKLVEENNKLITSAYTIEELDNLSLKIEEQKNIILSKEKEISSIDGAVSSVYDKKYVEKIKKEIENKENLLKEEKGELSNIDSDIFHYNFLAECFSNKSGGFKKYFIGEMIDVFNKKINQYLPFFFTEKVEIFFDRDLNETIKMDDFDITFKSFSQGQRQRAELAISFALFDVARIFFNNNCNLLVLDEVDKGIDIMGIKAMVNLLNGFDKQLRIFVISHNPLLEEEIPDKIKITRDENGFSLINH